MLDCTLADMTVARDGKLWRSSCVCGWTSKLCRTKDAGGRSRFYHVRVPATVTSRRSRTSFAHRPPGMKRAATYDSTAEACLEAKVKKIVRGTVAARDGHCRLARPQLRALFGPCTRVSEWAHWGDQRRSKTVNMAPELRHTTAGSLMLCGGPDGGHHHAYDKGNGARRLQIDALTDRGCDGPLRFTMGAADYEEPA